MLVFVVFAAFMLQVCLGISVIEPSKTIWKAGTTEFIRWEGYDPLNSPPRVNITLVCGSSPDSHTSYHVATSASTELGQYQWVIPANLTSGTEYVIQLGTDQVLASSVFFEITAA